MLNINVCPSFTQLNYACQSLLKDVVYTPLLLQQPLQLPHAEPSNAYANKQVQSLQPNKPAKPKKPRGQKEKRHKNYRAVRVKIEGLPPIREEKLSKAKAKQIVDEFLGIMLRYGLITTRVSNKRFSVVEPSSCPPSVGPFAGANGLAGASPGNASGFDPFSP